MKARAIQTIGAIISYVWGDVGGKGDTYRDCLAQTLKTVQEELGAEFAGDNVDWDTQIGPAGEAAVLDLMALMNSDRHIQIRFSRPEFERIHRKSQPCSALE